MAGGCPLAFSDPRCFNRTSTLFGSGMGTALRKRSYKGAGDKWLEVMFHNMDVDDHRERMAKNERNHRLASIRTKLVNAGIDDAWAEVALGIMKSNGFGLNQFSNRVLPVLRDRMRDCVRKEDRKARANELRNIDARKKKATVAEAKQHEAHCRSERRQISGNVKKAAHEAKKIASPDPAVDIEDVKRKALAATLSELSSDIQLAKAVLGNPYVSLHEIRLAVSKSLFLDYTRSGFLKCIAWMWFDFVVVCVLFIAAIFAIKDTDLHHGSGGIALFSLMAGPIMMIRHLVRLRKPRIGLSMPFLTKRFQSHYLSDVTTQQALPPIIRKSELPEATRKDLKEIASLLRLALWKRAQ